MKILLAIDPWIYRDSVGNQMFNLKNIFLDAMLELEKAGNQIKILIGEDMVYAIKKEKLDLPFETIVIPLKNLYKIYPNHYEAHKIQFFQNETQKQKAQTRETVHKHIKGWQPEIVISFTTPASVWKYVFDNCLSLQFENGIFSRSPYPYLCQLDPFGFLKETYPYKFEKQIKKCGLTKQEKDRILNLKNNYLQNIFNKYNPTSKEQILDFEGQKSILIPLSYNGVIINDGASNFKSQLDFLIYAMERIPPNVKVIATRHGLQMNGSIPKETEDFLLEKYKNLSFVYDLEKYAYLSQWLTPLVDAVISINSTVAFHASLLNKKVIALGDCEINTVANAENLNNIEKLLNDTQQNDEALSILYRLLTRHNFSLKKFKDGKWLNQRLTKMLKSFKNNVLYKDFTGLPLIEENEDEIFRELIDDAPGNDKNFKPIIK